MDPLGAKSIPAQDNIGASAPVPNFVENAGATDECAFLALLGIGVATAEEADLENKDISVLTSKADMHGTEEIQHTSKETASALQKEQHAAQEVTQAAREQKSTQNEAVQATAVDVSTVQKAMRIADRDGVMRNIHDMHVYQGVDADDFLKHVPASTLTPDDLHAAAKTGRLFYAHGKHAAFSPALGLAPGHVVKIRDYDGTVHHLKVRHFTDDEMKQVSDIITTHINQLPQASKEKEQEKSDDVNHHKPLQKPKLDTPHARKQHAHAKDTHHSHDRPAQLLEPSARKEVEAATIANVEAARAQIRNAQRLAVVISKLLIVIGDQFKTYENKLIENHHVNPISRATLNQIKAQG